jgi:hypothetical protein
VLTIVLVVTEVLTAVVVEVLTVLVVVTEVLVTVLVNAVLEVVEVVPDATDSRPCSCWNMKVDDMPVAKALDQLLSDASGQLN